MSQKLDNKDFEQTIAQELGLSVLKDFKTVEGRGCISTGYKAYDPDKYGQVFVKVNDSSMARAMFDGEFESLTALYTHNILRVPKPIKVIDLPSGGSAIVMEFLDMEGKLSNYSTTLGDQLARLHLHHASIKEKSRKAKSSVHKDETAPQCVSKFGFHINTWSGYLEMDNTWTDDWPSFYASKIETLVKILENRGDKQAGEARELWNKIVLNLSKFFEGIEIEPALLHGDLWYGNVSENKDGPVTYDPACYYGHSEYELAMGSLFGGFDTKFYDAYHKLIPRAPGFQKRQDLYMTFHNLNHWNHFPDRKLRATGKTFVESTLFSLQACVQHLYG